MERSSSEKVSCPVKVKNFFRKYFWEGQRLEREHEEKLENLPEYLSKEDRFFLKNRKLIGFLIPMIFFWLIWWSMAIRYNLFSLFPERYYMSITMVFGALVAGMTSEGGGAVAFPVMTLVLQIQPSVARDFSLMIQSCGMTAAAFTIFWMKITLEMHSVICCSAGAVFGFIFGVEVIDSRLTPAQKKMGFVSIWFSFAIALFILNMEKKRKAFDVIKHFNIWKAFVLALTGFIGGILTAISGSGVDVCSFSILTLLFQVSEKIATPTSVVLMAINTVVGFYWRQLMMGTVSQESWEYLAVCVPIVVICAPFGSLLSSHFHRLVLAVLIYILEIVSLVTGFVIVKPEWPLAIASFSIIFGAFMFFFILSKIGKRMALGRAELEPAPEPEARPVELPDFNSVVVVSSCVGVVDKAQRRRVSQ